MSVYARVCVCLPPLLARFCLSSSCAVGNYLLPLSFCAAPIVACCPLHLLCITVTRSESCTAPAALRFLNLLLLPSGGRLSPAVLPSPLRLSSCEFDFSPLFFFYPVLSSADPQRSHHLCTHVLVFTLPVFFPLRGRLLNRPLKGDLLYDSIVIELGHMWLADSHLCCFYPKKKPYKGLDLVC